MLSVFNAMLPGTLVLVLGFFGVLHSWLNAFAEMLRFADRMFYKVYSTFQFSMILDIKRDIKLFAKYEIIEVACCINCM